MKTVLFFCSLLIAGAASAASQDQPQDYGWSIVLTPQAGAGLSRMSLPTDVYLHARSASLDDVRLFDNNGKPLAFAITAPPVQSRTQRDSIPVNIFPVVGTQVSHSNLDGFDIHTGNDGRLLSVSSREGTAPGMASRLQALVLDAGKQSKDGRINALRFTLPHDTDNYNAQVLLEVSDDLKQWDAIATTTLNWLRNSDAQTLANDRIDFAPRSFRYARLSWQYGEPIAFAAIDAQQLSQTAIAAPRASIALQGTAGKSGGERLYATPIAIPADSISLQLDDSNTVMPVTLGVYHAVNAEPRHRLRLRSRTTTGSYFEPLLNTTFYRINVDGKEKISGELSMPVVQTAQWVLRPQIESATVMNRKSMLHLGWTPAQLVFLASGKPPYQLVFGKQGASAAALPLSQVAPGFKPEELLALPTVTPGQLVALNGTAPVQKTPDGAGLRLAALWAALLLGVAVLGFFAWRLLTQIRQEPRV
ncbi:MULTISPECIES: DUF3999 family protein [unclassified Janthinobacterium]|uniref:DUF3999 family protein n=1 Tax=unclassified Janthinobacterium TaxID=2610881 RepID=UPI001608DE74|nr:MULTISPECIES: DUF3999 family protein [unclassified Janthinobacterium]MBB5367220.1 hypothetical protein [Janthinobacterium sp. K2C7]MBB5380302.1 hypothetical protein [Janthinobacterium sp. K2Li3]MBB5385602.1 hypothetical protein [Janthinobacterium sp. K2E3]